MIPRYQAIQLISEYLEDADLVVSTTGMISRELFEFDDRLGNFYMIGSMGLASALGFGMALSTPNRRVIVLEGDGSALMSLGTMPLIASESPPNLIHVILDNEAYESTGGQPSISGCFDLGQTAISVGYPTATLVGNPEELRSAMEYSVSAGQLSLILVKCGINPIDGIARVSYSPLDIRDRFKAAVQCPV